MSALLPAGWAEALSTFAWPLMLLALPLPLLARWLLPRRRSTGAALRVPFGARWWKFDLPPAWRELRTASLDEVCLHQWLAAHQAIFDSALPTLRLAFEQFMAHPKAAMTTLTRYLGLADMSVPSQVPVTMATEAPRAQRWRKREQQLLALGRQAPVGRMMERLGYAMEPGVWS